MMERRIEISLTAFRRRSRPQIYTDETQIVIGEPTLVKQNHGIETLLPETDMDFNRGLHGYHG